VNSAVNSDVNSDVNKAAIDLMVATRQKQGDFPALDEEGWIR
jgi:hypothetical protein